MSVLDVRLLIQPRRVFTGLAVEQNVLIERGQGCCLSSRFSGDMASLDFLLGRGL
jgi:hypothetical protein